MSEPQPNSLEQNQTVQSENGPRQALVSPAFTCLLLAAVTFMVYWPVTGFEFTNYDDPVYYSSNHNVLAGLTKQGIHWAFIAGYTANWHPLTWLSYMADVELFGRGPYGPHLTNLLFHVGNTLLLFSLLRQLTGSLLRSAFVAMLFALHPLHVESVAWISERKDVLSTFFGFLSLLFYARYAESKIRNSQFAIHNYVLVLFFFACSLMSKPMLVTLPFVMLLLDYWPLQRFTVHNIRSSLNPLFGEKLPFFLMSAASCVVTFVVQRGGGAVQTLTDFPLAVRMQNTAVSYTGYLQQLFWPVDLAAHYPYPKSFSVWLVVLSVLIVLVMTATAIWKVNRRPYFAVGWFWFLGTLIPVIGLVQVGTQSMADRYTYVPLIGTFIVLVWGLNDVVSGLRLNKAGAGAAAALVLATCVWQTTKQLGYWKNSETLFQHALTVTENNALAHCNLGMYLVAKGRIDEGADHLQKAIQTDPGDGVPLSNLGLVLAGKGLLDEATNYCHRAIEAKPDCPEFLGALGAVLALRKEYSEAITQYEAALRLRPNYVEARVSLGKVLAVQQRYDEAIAQYNEALRLSPGNPEAHYNLGLALDATGKTGEGMEHYSKALRYKPDYVEAHNKLGDSLLVGRRVDEAALHYKQSLQFNPNQPMVCFNLGNVLALQKNYGEAVAQYTEAIKLAPDYAAAHKNLGQALARLGRRDEAIAQLTEAVRLKPDYQEAKQQLRALGVQALE